MGKGISTSIIHFTIWSSKGGNKNSPWKKGWGPFKSMVDLGGSRKAKFLKSSNLCKTSVRSKGSLRRFQWHSFHLKWTLYEKVIAFCCINETSKFGKMGVPRGTIGKVTRGICTVRTWWCGMCTNQWDDDMWHVQTDDVSIQSAVWTNDEVTHGSTVVSWQVMWKTLAVHLTFQSALRSDLVDSSAVRASHLLA